MTFLIRLINISLMLLFSFSIQSCSKVEKEITNSIGMKFVYIKPGTFMMGIKDDFKTKGIEGYKKKYINKGFYLQTTETTVGQWRKFIEETDYKTDAEILPKNNSYDEIESRKEIIAIKACTSREEISKKSSEYVKVKDGYFWNKVNYKLLDKLPVTLISRNDIYQFIKWLNKKEGEFYRLPTEMEWEYAARAGEENHICGGDLKKKEKQARCQSSILDEYGWYCFNSENRPHAVAQKKPNKWGVYDMHGNVWEHVEEKMNIDFEVKGISCRLIKGGSWYDYSYECLSGRRRFLGCNISNTRGFRLVRDIRERKR